MSTYPNLVLASFQGDILLHHKNLRLRVLRCPPPISYPGIFPRLAPPFKDLTSALDPLASIVWYRNALGPVLDSTADGSQILNYVVLIENGLAPQRSSTLVTLQSAVG